MNWRNVKVGLCPIGKFVFSHEDAIDYKQRIKACLDAWDIWYVDLDDVLPDDDGLVRDQRHVGPVVDFFRREGVDALFVPHCNFGTEGAAGMIAKKLGLPVLLWGPRDEAPLADGTRLRDTLCGLFATSKVLVKLGVPFTYVENCRIDEPAFRNGMMDFMRTASVVKASRRLRIGLVGGRIDFFWTTKINESELLERFGVEIVPIDLVKVVQRVRQTAAEREGRYREELAELKQTFTFEGFESDEPLVRLLALRDFYLEWAHEQGLLAIAVESFTSLPDELGAYDSLARALAGDKGLPVVCETDVHGAISSVLAEAATLERTPSFLADLTIRHPDNDDAVLLWHAEGPTTLIADDSAKRIGKHWILPSPLSGMLHARLRGGPLTVARFDGDGGRYRLIAGEGQAVPGPQTQNTYVWMEVDDWPKWERAFIEGPYIHHVAVVHDRVAAVLKEACKYVKGLEWDGAILS